MWTVSIVDEAEDEYLSMPGRERAAMQEAIKKLKELGDQLGAPHSSKVMGAAATLRELRPRRGSSRFRALYRRIDQEMVIGAFGPEAQSNRRGF